jgi:hypothetical protein
MKVKFIDNRFVISNGDADVIRIKTNEKNFDEILSLFFVPKIAENSRRTNSIRFE